LELNVRIALLVLIVASSVIAGARRLFDTAQLAVQLARSPDLEARRRVLFGSWYEGVQRLRRETPPDATIDFVMLRAEARDIAVLGAAELQPRDVRLFDGWDAWKRRQRAELLHDARAANAAPGPPPGAARFVVIVDPAAAEPFRW
jgi:hypothetical protein